MTLLSHSTHAGFKATSGGLVYADTGLAANVAPWSPLGAELVALANILSAFNG